MEFGGCLLEFVEFDALLGSCSSPGVSPAAAECQLFRPVDFCVQGYVPEPLPSLSTPTPPPPSPSRPQTPPEYVPSDRVKSLAEYKKCAILRYKYKRHKRLSDPLCRTRRVVYWCRSQFAITRERVNGRFVKGVNTQTALRERRSQLRKAAMASELRSLTPNVSDQSCQAKSIA